MTEEDNRINQSDKTTGSGPKGRVGHGKEMDFFLNEWEPLEGFSKKMIHFHLSNNSSCLFRVHPSILLPSH